MSAVVPLPLRRGKTRLITLEDLDRRSNTYKDTCALRDQLLADSVPEGTVPHAGKTELASIAALQGMLIRDMAARWLSGDSVDLERLVSLANSQRRILSDLGLEDRKVRHVVADAGNPALLKTLRRMRPDDPED